MNLQPSKYIKPRLIEYKSFEELFGDRNLLSYYDAKSLDWENLFLKRKVAIVGEPGFGKTRFLREVVINSENGICVDLKKMPLDSDVEKNLNPKKAIEVNKFNLINEKNCVVCFDALDEVNGEVFQETIEKINDFIKTYPRIQVIISCRVHHFEKWNPNIEFDAIFKIAPFDGQNIYEFFKNLEIDDHDSNKVWKKFRSPHLISVIQTPRYLEMLINVLQEKGVDYVLNLSKTTLFDEFINKKLHIESKKIGKIENQETVLIKRVQQTLALIMEINQSNILSEEDFWTIIDDISSNLVRNFKQGIPNFWDRTLIKKNAKNEIEFENTEFQEFLAAKEISRLGNITQTIFDFAFEPVLKEFICHL